MIFPVQLRSGERMYNDDACSLLASLYQTAREAITVARRANLPIQFIEAEGAAITVWASVLTEARKRDLLEAIENVVRGDYPGLDVGPAFLNVKPQQGRAPRPFPRLLGSTDGYEKITGSQPTFLPISFLATGLTRARSIVRIACGDRSYASGFLIDKNLLVTNHHVLSSETDAENARADFGYELCEGGMIQGPVSFLLDPAMGFFTSQSDDWTAVRIKGDANQDWGAIPLLGAKTRLNDFVNIIQHPGGGPKQIAIYHNLVVFADSTRVQYLTDTMPGSSGSPVFDSDWQLIAVHHSGGYLKRPTTDDVLFCNEGISASALIAGIPKSLL
jgi:hypothetical protein